MNIAPLVAIARTPGAPMPDRLVRAADDWARARRLTTLIDSPHLLVIAEASAPHLVLRDGTGIVWGTIFDRTTSRRVEDPSNLPDALSPIEQFARQHWGGYLVVRDTGNGVELLRDPSGAVACYHARLDGAVVFATGVSWLFDHGLLRSEIDWTIVTQALVYQDLRPARSALRGIDELLPGTWARVERECISIHTAWSLWESARPEREITSSGEAVERVRRVVENSVGAWGRCFGKPLLELSGGLDSSIIAAVLGRTNPGTYCVTFSSTEGDPDETPYARSIADHLGLELEVMRPDMALVDVTRSAASGLPRPSARAFSQAHDQGLQAIAEREGADAFFSGGGGDNVFAYLRSILPVIDRWKRGGGGVLDTIGDVAELTDVGFWTAFSAAVRRAARVRRPYRWLMQSQFISLEALGDLPFPNGHPWMDPPASILPGKRVHGQGLILIQNHLEGFGRLQVAPIISPLISQPIIEVCMAIPTWLWCEGGVNRAAARAAFSDRLPSLIVNRRTKGAFDSYSSMVFASNHATISDMLLDGSLAQHGIIDWELVSAKLAPGAASKVDIVHLLRLLDVEAWARAWTARPIFSAGP